MGWEFLEQRCNNLISITSLRPPAKLHPTCSYIEFCAHYHASVLHWRAMHLLTFSFSLLFLIPASAHAAPPAAKTSPAAEQRAARAYEAAVKEGPLAVQVFLAQFPKGADLHVHLSGAIYAETFIRDAAEDGICVDPVALQFAKPPCAAPLVPATQLSGNMAPADQDLYDRLINSFSMRSFVPTSGFSEHDQFFATFARFGGL